MAPEAPLGQIFLFRGEACISRCWPVRPENKQVGYQREREGPHGVKQGGPKTLARTIDIDVILSDNLCVHRI